MTTTEEMTKPALVVRNRLVGNEFNEACAGDTPLDEHARRAQSLGTFTRVTPAASGERPHHEIVCPTAEAVDALGAWTGAMLDLLMNGTGEQDADGEGKAKRNQTRRRNAFGRVSKRIVVNIEKRKDS
jgi:hypothetical protein